MKYFQEFYEQVIAHGGMCPSLKSTESVDWSSTSGNKDVLTVEVEWGCEKLNMAPCDAILCPLDLTSNEMARTVTTLRKLLNENP